MTQQKSILITGCSSGIGYDAAHRLQAAGWRVFASCRKADDVVRLRTEGLESVRIDYSLEGTIASGLHEVLEKTDGHLDALFNNGAFACPGAVEDLPRAALAALCAGFWAYSQLFFSAGLCCLAMARGVCGQQICAGRVDAYFAA